MPERKRFFSIEVFPKVEDFRSGNSNKHMNILIKRAWPFLNPICPSLHEHWAYIQYSRVPTLFGFWLFWGWFTTFKRIHEVWMTRTPQKMFDFYDVSLVGEASDPDHKGPPLWIWGIPDKLYFFLQNEITLWGKKHTALFQTYNWEKSSFFILLVSVYAQIYANTWQGAYMPPPQGQIGLKINFCLP